MHQFAAERGLKVVKTGQHAGLEVGAKVLSVQRQVRVGCQQFFAIGFFGFVANPLCPLPGLCFVAAGLGQQRLPQRTGFAAQPAALHQVVGLQHKFAFFKQGGLKGFDLVQKGDQVQGHLAHQFELGANARQFTVGGVPHLDKFVFEVNLKLTLQEFA